MANVIQSDLMELYYVKEMSIKAIAEHFGCSENNIGHYQKQFNLKKRDRTFDNEDEIELATSFANLVAGIDFERDVATLALATQTRASLVRAKIEDIWHDKYDKSPQVFSNGQNEDAPVSKDIEIKEAIAVGDATVVEVFRIDKNLPLPIYQSNGAVAVDLYARIGATLRPGSTRVVPCNLIIKVPYGYGAFILPRSGLAAKQEVTVLNTPGLIDRDYNGPGDEIAVILINHSHGTGAKTLEVKPGMKIAQMVILPTPEIIWKELDVPPGANNRSGFGSTGL